MTPAAAASHPEDSTGLSLDRLGKGARGVVLRVREHAEAGEAEAVRTLQRRLLEVGFVAGERFEIIEQAWPGGDPMAVRIGSSIFALRRSEAGAVLVVPDAPAT